VLTRRLKQLEHYRIITVSYSSAATERSYRYLYFTRTFQPIWASVDLRNGLVSYSTFNRVMLRCVNVLG